MVVSTDTEFERLVEDGKAAAREGSNVNWRLGDLAMQVTERYGRAKRLQDFADRIDVAYSSLATYRRVAEAFPESSRRSELLWGHHWAVASRKDSDELLARAEAEKWSVRQLLREVRTDEGSEGLAVKPPRLPDEEVAELAIDTLQQVVVEARRSSPEDAEERLKLLESRVFQWVDETNRLRLDNWYENYLTPVDRAGLEMMKRRWFRVGE